MKKRNTSIKLVLLTVFYISLSTAHAQETDGEYKAIKEMKDWGIIITPYANLASQATDVNDKTIRQSFGDLTSMTNAGFQLIATARYKRIKIGFDGTWATLGGDLEQDHLNVEVQIKQQILDFKGGYIVYENFEFEESKPLNGWALGFNVGGKYWSNDVTVNYKIDGQAPISGRPILIEDELKIPQSWWDLMIGVETQFALNSKVLLAVEMDVGGFGIGNSSKFTYNFTYINSFRVLKWMAIDAGFRNFNYKRVDGEGSEEVTTKVNVIGPLLGVSFML